MVWVCAALAVPAFAALKWRSGLHCVKSNSNSEIGLYSGYWVSVLLVVPTHCMSWSVLDYQEGKYKMPFLRAHQSRFVTGWLYQSLKVDIRNLLKLLVFICSQLNFVGVTVEPNRRYLHFPGTKHVFTPVPIGELTPPKQVYRGVLNLGAYTFIKHIFLYILWSCFSIHQYI